MNKINTAKTLLTALSKFEQFLAAIDTSILNLAQYSYQSFDSTPQTVEDIIDTMQRKKTLHNLHVRTLKLLETAPPKFRRVLILTFVHQLPANKIAEVIKKTERTVFRQLRAGLKWFADHIDEITDNYDFAQAMHEEAWFKNIYNRLQAGQEKFFD